MDIITSKIIAKPILENAIKTYRQSGQGAFVEAVHETILKRKIKYPILEYIASAFHEHIPESKQIAITDKIVALKENGSEVIAGKMLQLRLPADYEESIEKAVEYIIAGSHWLPCGTVGERVMGHSLLTTPQKTLPVLQKMAKHDNKWIVRSIGVADHYAVKKGLKKEYVDDMYQLLISLANTTDFHTRKGIGWAAKTTAKFYPDIITKYTVQVDSNPEIKQWFKSKIQIGLGRSFKYAHKYPG